MRSDYNFIELCSQSELFRKLVAFVPFYYQISFHERDVMLHKLSRWKLFIRFIELMREMYVVKSICSNNPFSNISAKHDNPIRFANGFVGLKILKDCRIK